ncbi:MAG: hypothetical protein C4317_01395 [Acidimicrobiia bacterium]
MTTDPEESLGFGRASLGASGVGGFVIALLCQPSVAVSLVAYALRLICFPGRDQVVRWRIQTAYGSQVYASRGRRKSVYALGEDLLEFGKWCRDLGRYRTIDCNTATFRRG